MLCLPSLTTNIVNCFTPNNQNFANKVQWIEPLFLAVMGAPDSEAVCDSDEFIEGSYRTMSSGWGVPGTTDVRTFGDVGTGRYCQTGYEWLLEVRM